LIRDYLQPEFLTNSSILICWLGSSSEVS